ncbi:MAG: hypothetical protein WBP46_12380 [Thiolinea sp.]
MMLAIPAHLPSLKPEHQNLVEQVLKLANQQVEEAFNQELHEALMLIYELEQESRYLALQALAGRISEITAPIGIGYCCVFIGANVEEQLNPELTLAYLFNHFIRQIQTIPRLANAEDLDEETYERALQSLPEPSSELTYGLQLMGQGLVAHLGFAPQLRQALAANTELLQLLEATEDKSHGIAWVLEVLKQHSDELIVIHAEERVGFKVRYANLANCFHLFTLLQAELSELMPGARALNELAVQVARHLSSDDTKDEAWWHYGSCLSAEPQITLSIWGEMSPKYINKLDQQQLILLWSPILATRTWDSGFYHPFIEVCPPKVEVLESLNAEDVEFWLAKVAAQTAN